MAQEQKDVPLMLRRRASTVADENEPDGLAKHAETGEILKVPAELELMSDHFPPRHEFSLDWLLRTPEVTVEHDVIRLDLANASAVYRIVEEMQVDGEIVKSTGFWGVLESEEVGVNG